MSNAVVALIGLLVEIAGSSNTSPELLGRRPMARTVRGPGEACIRDIEAFSEVPDLPGDSINEGLRGETGGFSGTSVLHSGLIRPRKESDLIAKHSMPPSYGVCLNELQSEADVWRGIRIYDGGGDVEAGHRPRIARCSRLVKS